MGGLLRASGMRSSDMATQAPVRVIEAGKSNVGEQLSDLWDHRELLYFLAWRDFKVRYKQTILGMAWAVIQPFLTMVIVSIFFGYLGKIPSDGIPYPVFAYCVLLPSCPSHPLLGLLEFRLYTPPELLLSKIS